MSSGDPLQSFLDTQRQEGRYFDSRAFTINSVKAMQKLGRFQLEDSGLWLVKLVQAAVAGGAAEVRITFGKRLVEVDFVAPPDWQADAILETVLSGTLPESRALSHLVTGVRACASSPNEAVTWSCGSARVELADDACKVLEIHPDERFRLAATRPARSRSVMASLTTSISQLAKQTAEEYDALRSRCWVSPIPILVDGQPLERGYGMVEGGRLERSPLAILNQRRRADGYTLTACLALRYLDSPAAEATLPVPERHQCAGAEEELHVQRPLHRNQTFLLWKSPRAERRAAVAWLAGTRAEGEKIFVHDGAVVTRLRSSNLTFERVLPSSMLAARMIFPVSAEQLDLSGFALRRVDVHRLCEPCYGALRELAHGIAEKVKSLSYIPATEAGARNEKILIGTALAALTLATSGFAAPVVGGGALFFVGVNRMQWRSQVRYAAREVATQLYGD